MLVLQHLVRMVLFGDGMVYPKSLRLGSLLQGNVFYHSIAGLLLTRIRIAGIFGAIIFTITKFGVMKRQNPVSVHQSHLLLSQILTVTT